ncbi:Hypothetical protein ACGLYG10_2296 [Actinomyces glycerinitolerans]|uniref:Uncharacterized protein n=2 Tax=Actinomyces glycerinitolerans TaxID=1892869 RepID=A0A1M4S1E4_9ACTO|nr:Hypothetical protein ACGLYG10_2296 [Actinomyces glycerinitolerans]
MPPIKINANDALIRAIDIRLRLWRSTDPAGKEKAAHELLNAGSKALTRAERTDGDNAAAGLCWLLLADGYTALDDDLRSVRSRRLGTEYLSLVEGLLASGQMKLSRQTRAAIVAFLGTNKRLATDLTLVREVLRSEQRYSNLQSMAQAIMDSKTTEEIHWLRSVGEIGDLIKDAERSLPDLPKRGLYVQIHRRLTELDPSQLTENTRPGFLIWRSDCQTRLKKAVVSLYSYDIRLRLLLLFLLPLFCAVVAGATLGILIASAALQIAAERGYGSGFANVVFFLCLLTGALVPTITVIYDCRSLSEKNKLNVAPSVLIKLLQFLATRRFRRLDMDRLFGSDQERRRLAMHLRNRSSLLFLIELSVWAIGLTVFCRVSWWSTQLFHSLGYFLDDRSGVWFHDHLTALGVPDQFAAWLLFACTAAFLMSVAYRSLLRWWTPTLITALRGH